MSLISMVKKFFTTRSEVVSNKEFAFSPLQCVGLLLMYLVGMSLLEILGYAITEQYLGLQGGIHPNVALAMYVLGFLIMVAIVRKPLYKSWLYFTSNMRENLATVFKTWGLMLLGTILIGIIFSWLMPEGSQAGNQTAIESNFWKAPYFMGFNIVVFAPVIEEIIFRGILYQPFRSTKRFWPAVIISCFIFAGLHVITPLLETGDLKELLFLLQYAFLAFFMIVAYEKTGSIWGAIMIHFLNNALSMLQLFL